MIPKGKAAGLLVIFVAIGLITATGAFTTVSAQRTATVTTAGDGSALLALNPVNTNYATMDGGTLKIAIDGSLGGSNVGSGVNLNALTQIDDVFSITNQGTQPVQVWITVHANNSNTEDTVMFYNQTRSVTDRTPIETAENGQVLDVGNTMNVSMAIDTRNHPGISAGDQLIDGITVHANATSTQ